MSRIALALLLLVALCGLSSAAFSQTIPNVKDLTPFSSQACYMSKAGYLRWQYFLQNKTWISAEEANELVKSQQ